MKLWPFWLCTLISCDSVIPHSNNISPSSQKLQPETIKIESVASIINKYNSEADSMKMLERNKPIDFLNLAEFYNSTAMEYYLTDTCKDKQTLRLRAKWKQRIISDQVKNFPLLRKGYTKFLHDVYWSNDIEVKSSGSTLTFIGRNFAANSNKQELMDAIHEQVMTLRFKRVEYKWVRDDDDYTFYKISSPLDNILKQ